MKASKFLAGMSAAALVASMLAALPAGAANPVSKLDAPEYDEANGVFTLYKTELEDPDNEESDRIVSKDSYIKDPVDLAHVCGFKLTLTVDQETSDVIMRRRAFKEDPENNPEEKGWVGGGWGINSDSTGWAKIEKPNEDGDMNHEWASFENDGKKSFGLEPVEGEENTYTLEFKGDDPLFTKDETFAQLWIQNWGMGEFEVVDLEVYQIEELPIGTAYVSLGADSWEAKLEDPAYSVEFSTADGWGWCENAGTDILDEFKAAITADGKTTADVDNVTAMITCEGLADKPEAEEANEQGGEDAGDAEDTEEEAVAFPGKFGYNSDEADNYLWTEVVPTDNKAVLTNILFDAVPESSEGAGDGHGPWFTIGGNEETGHKYKIDFYINYKSTGDPHEGMWIPQEFDEEGKVTKEGWNTYCYDLDQKSGDVTEQTSFVYLDREFEIGAAFAQEINKVWFVAPTIVFDEPFGDSAPNDLYEVKVRCEINGEEYKIDPSIKTDDNGNIVYLWAEATGNNAATNTARTYGGYNEWADKYIGQAGLENIESIKYYVTVSEKEQPEDSSEDESVPESTTESTPESTAPQGGGSNPGTGTAALATVGIALAGAAFVVSKKRK